MMRNEIARLAKAAGNNAHHILHSQQTGGWRLTGSDIERRIRCESGLLPLLAVRGGSCLRR